MLTNADYSRSFATPFSSDRQIELSVRDSDRMGYMVDAQVSQLEREGCVNIKMHRHGICIKLGELLGFLPLTTMTTERKAKCLVNYYTSVGAFSWSTRSKDAQGITITFILNLPPRRDIWHYIGVVMSERVKEGMQTFIPEK